MSKNLWYALLFVVFAVIPGWIFFKTESVMSANAIDAAEPFAEKVVPSQYSKLVSIVAKGGKLFEYYSSAEHTKFSLLVSEVEPGANAEVISQFPDSPEEILKTLIARQNARFTDQPALAHFTQAYLGSAFDPQRAYDVSRSTSKIPAIKFVTSKGANYLLAGWRAKQDDKTTLEIALLAMKKNEPVSPAVYEAFVATLKRGLVGQ